MNVICRNFVSANKSSGLQSPSSLMPNRRRGEGVDSKGWEYGKLFEFRKKRTDR